MNRTNRHEQNERIKRMKAKQKRWIQSVVATAKTTEVKLPSQRGNRDAVARRIRAAARRAA
ncbi:hypothetical protein OB2597_07175 [Pseudooceanicola batsensis HTCC2597]|uniref:Uncharacterized protein n=1 Tax=Pseudooceanicola batsensis (strain ATCC BAA-863 / DSM 15984 / KCTC 12145 / HTCC2597) TaxID=252305 RepID=A3TTS0_PSEBH|nr:hypothetical protein OB2597_07175 [Pseudooceanicola batsensis HTCC2597]